MRLDREGRQNRTDYGHAAGADAEFPRISGLHSPRRAADALWMRLFRLESSRLENVLRQARGDDGVRHVGHVVDPEVDRYAADDVGLLATEPSLLEEGDHVEHGVAAGGRPSSASTAPATGSTTTGGTRSSRSRGNFSRATHDDGDCAPPRGPQRRGRA